MRIAQLVAIGILTLPSFAAAREQAPLILKPDPSWAVNYADDSCRLARTFTDGSGQAVFLIDQFAPGAAFNLLVAGKALGRPTGRSVRFAFGPAGATQTVPKALDANFGSFGPVVMVSGMELVADPTTAFSGAASGAEAKTESNVVPLAVPNAPSPEQEKAITWLEVQIGSQPVRLTLGPMHAPMAALRKCTEELTSHWGIDVEAHKTLTRPVTPRGNPGTWVSYTDYPPELVSQGTQGVVQFRLAVDEQGNVTGCHIQQSTRPAEFDKAVCNVMTKRARFDPALDASGKPIRSYWRSSFRFEIR